MRSVSALPPRPARATCGGWRSTPRAAPARRSCKVLLRERLGRDPRVRAHGARASVDMLAVADAALLIGDPALDHEERRGPRLDLGRGVDAADRPALRLRVLGGPAGGGRRRRACARLQSALAAGLEVARPTIAAGHATGRPGARRDVRGLPARQHRLPAGGGGAGGAAGVLPPGPRASPHPGRPGAEVPCRSADDVGQKVRDGGAADPRGGGRAAARRRLPGARGAGRRGALAQAPRAGRHLHHRPQHQLHERLHRAVRLLRLLPRPALEGGLPPRRRRSSRRRSRRRSRSAAGRSCSRAGSTPTSGSSTTRSCSAG